MKFNQILNHDIEELRINFIETFKRTEINIPLLERRSGGELKRVEGN
jgi:hypothetical protein